jgi:putative chitinase
VPVTYTVKAGDSLSGIASRFRVTLAALQKENNITNASRIRVGQVLRIPAAGGAPAATPTPTPAPVEITHVVRSGESLLSIARRYSVTVKSIQDLNKISNPNLIKVGQRIRIPSQG